MHNLRRMPLSYLTLQDVLLLSFMLTKKQQRFDPLVLEEAVFYQYAPGQSTNLAKQGARLLTGFVKKRPFAEGNEACAFVGTLAFLESNGKALELRDDEAVGWASPLLDDPALAEEAIRDRMRDEPIDTEHGVPDWEEIFGSIVERFANTVAALAEPRAAAH